MTRIDPVVYEGVEIVPLKFLKALLPEPSSLGETYSEKPVSAASSRASKTASRESILFITSVTTLPATGSQSQRRVPIPPGSLLYSCRVDAQRNLGLAPGSSMWKQLDHTLYDRNR